VRNDRLLRLLNWNIRHPCAIRATEQASWLADVDADIVVLTEGNESAGCDVLTAALLRTGYTVIRPNGPVPDYSVIVATRLPGTERSVFVEGYRSSRLTAFRCQTRIGLLELLALYVPSRGPRGRRNVAKRIFQDDVMRGLRSWRQRSADAQLIVVGDLNVVASCEKLRHKGVFREWEYQFYRGFASVNLIDAYSATHPTTFDSSWYGRSGSGYRFDHIFVSSGLVSHIRECTYQHAVRIARLSDHAAMLLLLS
jgi:exodeoxyribonuclease-3